MLKSLWNSLIMKLSHLMLYRYPPFLIVRPDLYAFKGKDYIRLMDLVDRGILMPGDIILRKSFSSITSGFIPGPYSHAGLYVGEGEEGYPAVIHAMSDGVDLISLYDFCRTDDLKVVRPKHLPKGILQGVVRKAYQYLGTPYDFDFSYSDDRKLYCFELVGRCYEGVKNIYKFKLSTMGYWLFKRKVLLSSDILRSEVDIIFEKETSNE